MKFVKLNSIEDGSQLLVSHADVIGLGVHQHVYERTFTFLGQPKDYKVRVGTYLAMSNGGTFHVNQNIDHVKELMSKAKGVK